MSTTKYVLVEKLENYQCFYSENKVPYLERWATFKEKKIAPFENKFFP